ncbi:MAG TPA: hypothetical protein VGN12_13160 [Pirellulales bacterium]
MGLAVPARQGSHKSWMCSLHGTSAGWVKPVAHGWPFRFTERIEYPGIKSSTLKVAPFDILALLGDLIVAAVIATITWFVIRRILHVTRRGFAFRLRSLMLVVAIFAVIGAICQWNIRRVNFTVDAISRLDAVAGVRPFVSLGEIPDWLMTKCGFIWMYHAYVDLPEDEESIELVRRLGAQYPGTVTLRIDLSQFPSPLTLALPFRGIDEVEVSADGSESLAFLQAFPDLRSLRISVSSSSEDARFDCSSLGRLSTLRVLIIQAYGIPDLLSDDEIKELLGLTLLEMLTISSSDITGDGLKALSELPALQSLVLVDALVDDESLRYLDTFPSLSTLGLGGTAVTEKGLEYIRKAPHLRRLKLDHLPLTDAGMRSLSSLQKLEALSLSHTRISDAGFAELGKMPQLKDLDIDKTDIKSLTPAVNGFPQLHVLTASDTRVTDVNASALQQRRPSIRIVRQPDAAAVQTLKDQLNGIRQGQGDTIVIGPTINNADLSGLNASNVGGLTTIWNGSSFIDKRGIKSLGKLTSVLTLHLRCPHSSDEWKAWSDACPNIRFLELQGTTLDDADLVDLGMFNNLREIYVGDTTVTIAGIIPYLRTQKIELLGIDAHQLAEGRAHLTSLRSLPRVHVGSDYPRNLPDNWLEIQQEIEHDYPNITLWQ